MLLDTLRTKLFSPAESAEHLQDRLNPFAFWINQRSTLGNLGGPNEPDMAGYAFHTTYMRPSGPTLQFEVRIADLKPGPGRLFVELIRKPLKRIKANSRRLKVISIDDLAAADGTLKFTVRARRDCLYALMGATEDVDMVDCQDLKITVVGATSPDEMKARLDAARHGFLAEPGLGPLAELVVNTPPDLRTPLSQMCTSDQMTSSLYIKLCRRIRQAPTTHRKQWEFVYILRALEFYDALKKGNRGLGFGVGVEPLPSVFAGMGCKVVATDLPGDDERALLWHETNQLGSLARLHRPEICDEARFQRLVSFRHADMNAIPDDLVDFDFTWSSCAFEHLGSIDSGLKFFEESLRCLKPGGIAVHTTELNLSSNADTIDNDSTVLFRRCDFERLALRLTRKGHRVIPISFDPGHAELDNHIDFPPYSSQNHLRINLLAFTSTSFGLIVQKQ